MCLDCLKELNEILSKKNTDEVKELRDELHTLSVCGNRLATAMEEIINLQIMALEQKRDAWRATLG